jgi:hypothetical protein
MQLRLIYIYIYIYIFIYLFSTSNVFNLASSALSPQFLKEMITVLELKCLFPKVLGVFLRIEWPKRCSVLVALSLF